ncbi:MAG: hypothetical protein IJP92_06140 [Lachnospiraceae bacterium]|nr:hypothetical protein [Lachnospiraceae bacterium]
MTDDRKAYLNERVNLRCFYLRLFRQLWVPVLTALAGALAGFVLYALVTRVTQPLLYESTARIRIQYTEQADYELVFSTYNTFSWRDLLETDAVGKYLEDGDVIADAAAAFRREVGTDADLAALQEQAKAPLADTTRSAQETIDASIYSDIRILHITATSPVADTARYRAMLYAAAIEHYAEEDMVIRGTELLGYSPAVERTYPQRRVVATITGAIIGLLAGFLILWIRFLLNNAVYVPEDVSSRYGIPVLGVLPKHTADPDKYPLQLKADLDRHMKELCRYGTRWLILRAQDTDMADKETSVGAILRKYSDIPEESDVILTEKTTAEVNEMDVVLLHVRSGAQYGTQYTHLIAEAAASGNPVKGIILTDSDNNFLKKYYRY